MKLIIISSVYYLMLEQEETQAGFPLICHKTRVVRS